MIASTFSLLLAAFAAEAPAHILARLVPLESAERTIRPVGGYALIATTNGFCPNDLDVCGSDTMCCPTSLTCVQAEGQQSDNRCCPGTEDCSAGLRTSPYCADDSWSLWDKAQGGIYADGYFCCGPENVGLLDGTCIEVATLVSANLEALALAPGGSVLSTSTSVASTAIATSIAGSTIVVVGTTTTSSSALTSTSTVEALSSLASNPKKSTTTSSVAAVATGPSTSAGAATTKGSSTSSSAAASFSRAKSDAKNYKNAGEYGAAAFVIFVAAII